MGVGEGAGTSLELVREVGFVVAVELANRNCDADSRASRLFIDSPKQC